MIFLNKIGIREIEITPWKVRAYGFYSGVETYRKTNEWAQRTSEFSDTLQQVNKNRTKHFPFVYFIGTEIYLRRFLHRKFWGTSVERNANDKISLVMKFHWWWTSYGFYSQ